MHLSVTLDALKQTYIVFLDVFATDINHCHIGPMLKMLKRVIQKIIRDFEMSQQKSFKFESTMHYAFLRV